MFAHQVLSIQLTSIYQVICALFETQQKMVQIIYSFHKSNNVEVECFNVTRPLWAFLIWTHASRSASSVTFLGEMVSPILKKIPFDPPDVLQKGNDCVVYSFPTIHLARSWAGMVPVCVRDRTIYCYTIFALFIGPVNSPHK